MNLSEASDPAQRFAELVDAWPDSFATRDERAAWYEKKAELFEAMAAMEAGDTELASSVAIDARAKACELRGGTRGELRVVGGSGV
jgi:hypothetical protein